MAKYDKNRLDFDFIFLPIISKKSKIKKLFSENIKAIYAKNRLDFDFLFWPIISKNQKFTKLLSAYI